ncbi:MAG: hypothetical protein ACREMA_05105, partial [Longimicrobiales bacterium]
MANKAGELHRKSSMRADAARGAKPGPPPLRWACAGPGLVLMVVAAASSPVSGQSSAADTSLTLSAAIARSLELDPQIARARWALEGSRGLLLRAQGAFDLVLTTSAVHQDAGSASESASAAERVTQYQLGFGQRLRAGIVVTPQVKLQRSQLPLAELSPAYHAADLGLTMTVPLLRGRGGGLLTAAEDAALLGRQASGGALQHQRAVSVLFVVQAYWGYVT